MSYIVPIEIPKFCDDCPFGRCVFSRPKWTEENHNEVLCKYDGEEAKPNTHGYVCNIEFEQNGKYANVMRGEYKERIPKPDWCPLVEVKEQK